MPKASPKTSPKTLLGQWVHFRDNRAASVSGDESSSRSAFGSDSWSSHSLWYRLIGALAICALGTFGEYLIGPFVKYSAFSFLFFAIGSSAWFLGAMAGYVAVVATTIAGAVLFQGDPFDLLVFALLGTSAAALISRGRSSEEKAKAVLADLAEERTRLKVALSAAQMGTFDWDVRNGRHIWSRETEELYGFAPGEFPGTTQAFEERIHPDDRAGLNKAIEKSLKEKKDYLAECRILLPNGDIRWMASQGKPIFDAEGTPLQIVGVTWETTRKKQAEEALAASESRYRTLVESVSHLMWSSRPDGTPEFFNHRWSEFTGLPISELMIDSNWLEAVHPEDREKVVQAGKAAIGGQTPFSFEVRLWNAKKGEYAWHLARTVPLRDSKTGKILSWYGSAVNIQDQKKASEILQFSNEELERRVQERTEQLRTANQELEAFSYSVSHDLRAPLRSIDGFGHRLLTRGAQELSPRSVEDLNRIRNAAKTMGRLIDDLLNLSRISRIPIQARQIDITAMSKSIVDGLRSLEPERDVEVRIQDGLQAFGDEGLIQVALQNLIGNAWKFTSKKNKACIEIGKTVSRGRDVIYIKDNGAGFDMAYSKHLFGAFQRLHDQDEFEGTGIGLATVRRIINRHRGDIWAEAEPDKGAVFYIALPARKEGRHDTEAYEAASR